MIAASVWNFKTVPPRRRSRKEMNLLTPRNGALLTGLTELSPGQFQLTDPTCDPTTRSAFTASARRKSGMIVGAQRLWTLEGEGIAGQFVGDNHHAVGAGADLDGGAVAVFEEIALEHGASTDDVYRRQGRTPVDETSVGEREQTRIVPGDALTNGAPKAGAVDVEIAVCARQGLDADAVGAAARVSDVEVGDVNHIGLRGEELESDVHAIKVHIAHLSVHRAAGRGSEPRANGVAEREDVLHDLPIGAHEVEGDAIVLNKSPDIGVVGPERPEMHVHDAPNVIALVHRNADSQWLAIKAADQMPARGMGGEIHTQVWIDHKDVLDGDVIAATGPNRPGVGGGRVIKHLVGIKDGDAFESGVGALERDEGNARGVAGVFDRQERGAFVLRIGSRYPPDSGEGGLRRNR